jgi:hypothetical protein
MSLDPQTEKLLVMIEAQKEIGGRFENVRRCGLDGGNGSFSLIVEAEDKQRNIKVALKFLHPFERDNYRRRCFEREPEILARAIGQRDIINSSHLGPSFPLCWSRLGSLYRSSTTPLSWQAAI